MTVWRKKGELERALADFQQAIRIQSACRAFVRFRGAGLQAQGQIDRARNARAGCGVARLGSA